jgi:hypothetical protein
LRTCNLAHLVSLSTRITRKRRLREIGLSSTASSGIDAAAERVPALRFSPQPHSRVDLRAEMGHGVLDSAPLPSPTLAAVTVATADHLIYKKPIKGILLVVRHNLAVDASRSVNLLSIFGMPALLSSKIGHGFRTSPRRFLRPSCPAGKNSTRDAFHIPYLGPQWLLWPCLGANYLDAARLLTRTADGMVLLRSRFTIVDGFST